MIDQSELKTKKNFLQINQTKQIQWNTTTDERSIQIDDWSHYIQSSTTMTEKKTNSMYTQTTGTADDDDDEIASMFKDNDG